MKLHDDDSGFSLVEVIVALLIIGIVAASSLWFFINGMQTSSNLQRQQTAVSIATSAMEESFIHDPKVSVTEGVSGLVIDRASADVNSAFTTGATLGIAGVSDTYAMSDPAASGPPSLPIVETVTRAGIDYQVYTLVGACFRTTATNGSDQPCTKVSGYASEPSAAPAGTARLLRVIVFVTWESVNGECEDDICRYGVSSLVDPSNDLEWNRVIVPVAVDDTFSFATTAAGSSTTLTPLTNDVVGFLPSYPVTVLTGLPAGTGTLSTPSSTGTINYTPPAATKAAWRSGIFNFTYRVKDSRGQYDDAIVSIYLQPDAAADSFTVNAGQSTSLNVLANDLGSPAQIVLVSGPSLGSVSISGTTLTYLSNVQGNDTFTYQYKDASDLLSPQVTVSVNVQAVTPGNVTQAVPYNTSTNANDGWVDISDLLRNGYAGASIKVLGNSTPGGSTGANGAIRIDGVNYTGGSVTGSVVEFRPATNTSGEWSFPYTLVSGSYTSPATGTATLQATALDAIDDYLGSIRRNTTHTIHVVDNDQPSPWPSSGYGLWAGYIKSGCGTIVSTNPAAGTVRIQTSGNTNGCYFYYQISQGTAYDWAAVYFDVTKSGATIS